MRSCIDKCQSLRREGISPHTIKSKSSLLHSYLEEMKSPNLLPFKRASTMVNRKRPKHHMAKRLSFQFSLPSIDEIELKEEEEERVGVKKKTLESRPTFLNFSGGASPKEKETKKAAVILRGDEVRRKGRFSLEEQPTKMASSSFSGPGSSPKLSSVKTLSNFSGAGKKSALKKHSAPNTLSPFTDSDSPLATRQGKPLGLGLSPRLKRKPRKMLEHSKKAEKPQKSRRNPPLAQLKHDSKFTSSEVHADVEDFDVGSDTIFSPKGGASSPTNLPKRIELSIANRSAIDLDLSSPTDDIEWNDLVVQAEVHHDASSPTGPRSPSPAVAAPSPQSKSWSPTRPPRDSNSSLAPYPPRSRSPLFARPPPTSYSPSLVSPSRSPRHSPPPITLPSSLSPPLAQHALHLDSSHDPLIPRDSLDSSPPQGGNGIGAGKHRTGTGSAPWQDGSASDGETETDTDTLLPHDSSSSLPRRAALSPNSPMTAAKKKLSFDRRQGSRDGDSGHSGGGSSLPHRAALSPNSPMTAAKKKLSFDRRQGSRDGDSGHSGGGGSSLPRRAALSPNSPMTAAKQKLSFDRRQGSRDGDSGHSGGGYYKNISAVEEGSSTC